MGLDIREILFRGKQFIFNKPHLRGDWAEGSLIQDSFNFSVIKNKDYTDRYGVLVDPNTIGQFTGLCDKNGKKIFEGDIVLTQPIKTRPNSKSAKTKRRLGKVVWHSGKRETGNFFTEPSFNVEFIDKENDYRCWDWSLFYDCEVIGNIHDNPELLGGKSE